MSSYPATMKIGTLPPIMKKRTSRNWKELPTKGDSIGINDPTLKQGYLGDLLKKSKNQLEELIIRQDKILNDSNFIKKLRDHGERLRSRKKDLQEALDILLKNEANGAFPIPDVNAMEWKWRDPSKPISKNYREMKDLKTSLHNMNIKDDSDDDDEDVDPDPLVLMATHSSDVPVKHGQSCDDKKASILDPAEAIEEELRKLDINDQNLLEKSCETLPKSKPQYDESQLSKDFCSKLLVNYEKNVENNELKKVFKPFRTIARQNWYSNYEINKSKDSESSQSGSIQNDGEDIKIFDSKVHQASNNNPTISCKPSSNESVHPSFGISAKPLFVGLKKVNISADTWHKSPLWSCESSATGPLESFGRISQGVKLLSMRESLVLEKSSHERRKQLQMEETTARLALSVAAGPIDTSCGGLFRMPAKLYCYRDVNDTGHFLDHQDYYNPEEDNAHTFEDEEDIRESGDTTSSEDDPDLKLS